MDGILNTHTVTVHKRQTGSSEFETSCGASNTLDSRKLEEVVVERATAEQDANKCGRCFDDGGGY